MLFWVGKLVKWVGDIMDSEFSFRDRVVLVTGAASGIGAATARAFAQAGARTALLDIQKDKGDALATAIRDAGGEAIFIPCDVSQPDAVQAAIARIITEYGALHVAFNNAGIEGTPADTVACTVENWDRVLGINLRGIWLCMKYQIPHMIEAGGGAIVNCASVAGLVGIAQVPAYTASKHGVIGLTRTAALEFVDRNIRVNAICPGVIDTPMVERFTGGDDIARAGLLDNQPLQRMGQPEEIARTVLFLAGSGSSFTTGQAFAVDGGWTAR